MFFSFSHIFSFLSTELQLATKVMERTVSQNAQQAIFHDFKYFTEDADAQREVCGSIFNDYILLHPFAPKSRRIEEFVNLIEVPVKRQNS